MQVTATEAKNRFVSPPQHKVMNLGMQFNLVVLQLHQSWAPQDLQQNGHTLAGHALHQPLDIAQGGVLEPHGLAGLERAECLQGGLVTFLLKLADALHQVVLQRSGLETETHDVGNAFGAAHHRNALAGAAGPEQDVAREHGLKNGHSACLAGFEFFEQRQIDLEGLLLQIELGRGLVTGLGVGQVPGFAAVQVMRLAVWRGECGGHAMALMGSWAVLAPNMS